MASGAVIFESVRTTAKYYGTDGPDMVFTNLASMMLFVVVLVKIAVWRVAKNEYEKHNKISLFVASAWWGFGLYTVLSTGSLAVLASLVDATIDLAAQGVLLAANALANAGKDKAYPVGVSRLEPIGVVVCSVLMAMASGAVIFESLRTTAKYYGTDGPDMVFTNLASMMLFVVVLVKIAVWWVAKNEYEKNNNVSLEALALDNFNDILSNAS
eukprot:CAMPEP_0177365864 /NCGR_PEP_ID=MMETSP0368-20130122/39553_1 /TAXON_ID=447022 ORGANISM="Scrippsiella hangoei-like, Strain SHHI-4" /NCGR_SAMPLE_ID=MMETSP0368 /ASSEMBLY_ACC=CAM_ASM_000363 /LENGTH=212 /DNA_ID=CAMNT_0018828825 /DNA_START=69 /DNA_END=703 /DNA_ORIENTATION=-